MRQLSDVTRYALATRLSRDVVVRRILTGRIRATYAEDLGWIIDPAEFAALEGTSIDTLDVSPLSSVAEISL